LPLSQLRLLEFGHIRAVAPEPRAPQAPRFRRIIFDRCSSPGSSPTLRLRKRSALAPPGSIGTKTRFGVAGVGSALLQGIEIKRETGRGFARLVHIAPATSEVAAHRRRQQREGDAGVILEAAMIGRIDGQCQIGRAARISATTSRSACALFGPPSPSRQSIERFDRRVGRTDRVDQRFEQRHERPPAD
jgi:hypothetical protein